nr:MAG TPA: hypothetical protein [Caudoviricetes sp.]
MSSSQRGFSLRVAAGRRSHKDEVRLSSIFPRSHSDKGKLWPQLGQTAPFG